MNRLDLDLKNLDTYHQFCILDLVNGVMPINDYCVTVTRIGNRVSEILKEKKSLTK